jgi:predicted porin
MLIRGNNTRENKMKKKLLSLLILSGITAMAQAQITTYGLLEETTRFTTNVDKAGSNQFQLSEGILQGSRLGFKGMEDLGTGLKAVFNLEAGFTLHNGMSGQGGRLFGREASVGLMSKDLGRFTIGRQTTLLTDFDAMTETYGFANSPILVGYQGALGGLRFDNSLKYSNRVGNFSIATQYSFGNQLGDNTKNSTYAVMGGYTDGPFDIRSVYQNTKDTKDGNPGTLPGQTLQLSGIGGSYNFGKTKLYGQYFNAQFNISNQKNDIFVISVQHNLAPNLKFLSSIAHDTQKNLNAGTRNSITGLLDYSFSPRTDIYTEVDYIKLNGNYSNYVYNLNNPLNPNTNSFGFTLGLRHKF